MAGREFWDKEVTIYLDCTKGRRLKHAGHCLGSSNGLDRRGGEHATAKGTSQMQAFHRDSIEPEVVRTWTAPQHFEVKLHRMNINPRLCPVCAGPRALNRGIYTTKTKEQ
jgi:hypothetical protein